MSSVINVIINENGFITNLNDVLSYIDSLGANLNTKEYVGNLNQFLIFNRNIKNSRTLLMVSSKKLRECLMKENSVDSKDNFSIFTEQKVLTRY